MTDMVERISEAIWQAEWARAGNGGKRRVPWSEIAQTDQERYRFVARAAIEAMLEPTEAMMAAGMKSSAGGLTMEDILEESNRGEEPLDAAFTAMINAALSRKNEGQ